MQREFSTKTLIYLRAAELVEKGHCKGSLWQRNGHMAMISSGADHFCYYGALISATGEITGDRLRINDYALAPWNDAPETTAAMVAARLREEAFK